MAKTEGQDRLTEPTRIRRSIVWRLKVRLQFTGWLQYLLTAAPAAVLLAAAFIGWLIGRWSVALFWLPLSVAVLLLAATLFDIVTVKWDVRPREPLPPRRDDVATFDLIRSRTSCRSYQSRDLTPEDRAELADVINVWTDPERLIGSSPIRLEYVAAPLTVWPTVGAHEFIVAIAPRDYDRTAIIDVGRSLQHVVLHATRMGVATCWIGPGADQSSVIAHLGEHFDIDRDHVVCVCAVGYRSRFQPLMIRAMGLLTHRRLPLSTLFFADPDFRRPLTVDEPPFASFGRCYEVCRWSPSSYNSQTTRCVGVTRNDGEVARFDFYASTTSMFYAPVALGIWCANWEAGCESLGMLGRFAVLSARERRAGDSAAPPRYGASWMVGSRARAPKASQETGAARRAPERSSVCLEYTQDGRLGDLPGLPN